MFFTQRCDINEACQKAAIAEHVKLHCTRCYSSAVVRKDMKVASLGQMGMISVGPKAWPDVKREEAGVYFS